MTRDKLLGQARADLVSLPDLTDELARLLTERPDATSRPGKPGSRAPLRLDVLHLVDLRRKPGWDGADPRQENYTDWLGVAPLLESWVRVLWEDLPEILELTETATVRSEAFVLVEFWPFIEAQQWGEELATDVTGITKAVRLALGIKPEYRPRCRWCRDVVNPVEAETHKTTTWEACAYGLCAGCGKTYPKGPALDALAQVQPPMPLAAISGITGIPVPTLHRWVDQGLIAADPKGNGRPRKYDLAAVQALAAKTRTTRTA